MGMGSVIQWEQEVIQNSLDQHLESQAFTDPCNRDVAVTTHSKLFMYKFHLDTSDGQISKSHRCHT